MEEQELIKRTKDTKNKNAINKKRRPISYNNHTHNKSKEKKREIYTYPPYTQYTYITPIN
jgi:hypothetical protein